MKILLTIIAIAAFSLAPQVALYAADAPRPAKPNIIFILADDKYE